MEFSEYFRNFLDFGNFRKYCNFRKLKILRKSLTSCWKGFFHKLETFSKLVKEVRNKLLGSLEFLAIKNEVNNGSYFSDCGGTLVKYSIQSAHITSCSVPSGTTLVAPVFWADLEMGSLQIVHCSRMFLWLISSAMLSTFELTTMTVFPCVTPVLSCLGIYLRVQGLCSWVWFKVRCSSFCFDWVLGTLVE